MPQDSVERCIMKDSDVADEKNGVGETVRDESVAEETQVPVEQQGCGQELAQLKEQYARTVADFDNYRKRMAKEQIAYAQAVQARVLGDVLTIVDDFERALAQDVAHDDIESWLEGFSLIHASLLKMLEKYNVKPMTAYTTFDPHFHEAIAQIESADHASGQIVEVVQQGYLIGDSVLRHAKVTVAK